MCMYVTDEMQLEMLLENLTSNGDAIRLINTTSAFVKNVNAKIILAKDVTVASSRLISFVKFSSCISKMQIISFDKINLYSERGNYIQNSRV